MEQLTEIPLLSLLHNLPWRDVIGVYSVSTALRNLYPNYWTRRARDLLGMTNNLPVTAEGYRDAYLHCYPGAKDAPILRATCMEYAGSIGDQQIIDRLLTQGVSVKHAVRGAARTNNPILDKLLDDYLYFYHYAVEGALEAGDIKRAARYYREMTDLDVEEFPEDILNRMLAPYSLTFGNDHYSTIMAESGFVTSNDPEQRLTAAIANKDWNQVNDMLSKVGTLPYSLADFVSRLDILTYNNLVPYISDDLRNNIATYAATHNNIKLLSFLLSQGAQVNIDRYPWGYNLERETVDLLLNSGVNRQQLIQSISNDLRRFYEPTRKRPYL